MAEAALSALKWDVWVPNTVTLTVNQGRITLQGQVEWNYQRDSAEQAVRHLAGVVSVYNTITIKSRVSVGQVKEKVQIALKRQAKADAQSIHVDTSGGTVTLSGHASSWAAWGAQGVTAVVNDLRVSAT
jgi:VCBS repeat-containing protein